MAWDYRIRRNDPVYQSQLEEVSIKSLLEAAVEGRLGAVGAATYGGDWDHCDTWHSWWWR